MLHLLKVTAFNLPRLTRSAGLLAALAMAAINARAAMQPATPGYLRGLLAAAGCASILAALALLVGRRTAGWRLAVTVSALCFAGYLVSRTAGLPGFPAGVGAWHQPLGTAALLVEVSLAALYVSLLAGWNVDTRGQRDWDTYFSRPRPGRAVHR